MPSDSALYPSVPLSEFGAGVSEAGGGDVGVCVTTKDGPKVGVMVSGAEAMDGVVPNAGVSIAGITTGVVSNGRHPAPAKIRITMMMSFDSRCISASDPCGRCIRLSIAKNALKVNRSDVGS